MYVYLVIDCCKKGINKDKFEMGNGCTYFYICRSLFLYSARSVVLFIEVRSSSDVHECGRVYFRFGSIDIYVHIKTFLLN